MSKPLIDVPKEKLQQVRMDMFRKVQREKEERSALFRLHASPCFA